MNIRPDAGGKLFANKPQYAWFHHNGEEDVMQTCNVAGHVMMAITDDHGGFDLHYLNFTTDRFSSMDKAKEAAPEFAKAVLSYMAGQALEKLPADLVDLIRKAQSHMLRTPEADKVSVALSQRLTELG